MENLKKIDGMLETESDLNLKRDFMKTADKISHSAKEVTTATKNTFGSIQTYCRENPGKAMGIAAGVGTLMGMVLVKAFSRRQSSTERILSNLFRSGEETWNHVKSGFSPAIKKMKDTIGE